MMESYWHDLSYRNDLIWMKILEDHTASLIVSRPKGDKDRTDPLGSSFNNSSKGEQGTQW